MTKVLVIGGGPGGYVAAIRAAQLGAEVTLVEKGALGGTCLNVGCIPTKALLHAAHLYEEAGKASAYGIAAAPTLDFPKVMARKNAIIKQLVGGVAGLLKANKVRVVQGAASFAGPAEVAVALADGGSETVAADKIIIAAGSLPALPPIPGIDSGRCIDSTGALSLEAPPAAMVVIGGGVIGVEMATAYAAFGVKVTVVELLDEILPVMDRELSRFVRSKMARRGVEFLLGAKVESIAERDGAALVAVDYRGEKREVAGERVLVAVGRRVNSEGLGLDRAGVATERGRVVVDSRQETSVPGVYAVGDCTGGVMLAHVASEQGEIAAENALGGNREIDLATNPSCVYTNPEFAGVGLTEEQAKETGVAHKVGKFPLQANGKTLIMGGEGMVKIIADAASGRLLGVHIAGPRATDLIGEGALAIGLDATAEQLAATIHAHPTVGEAVREAALALDGRAIHIPNR